MHSDIASSVRPAFARSRARWYERSGGALANAPYVDLSNKYAGGGLTSTVVAREVLGWTWRTRRTRNAGTLTQHEFGDLGLDRPVSART